jgi:putative intracellular protease/amidase
MTQQVGIYIYDEVEVLDFAGPYEVFSTASRVLRRTRPQTSAPFQVALVAEAQRTILARASFPSSPTTPSMTIPARRSPRTRRRARA